VTDRSPDGRSDIEALLGATLADDLPPAVEGRLNAHIAGFLASRRTSGRQSPAAWVAPWQTHLSLRVAASAALLACGTALHVAGSPPAIAAPVGRMQESVALWKAIESAPSMRCAGGAADEFRSPAQFADRVYRRWVLVASKSAATDAVELTFRSPADGVQYELVVDRHSMLPRRVVKTPLHSGAPPRGAAAGYDTACTWGAQTPKERNDGQR